MDENLDIFMSGADINMINSEYDVMMNSTFLDMLGPILVFINLLSLVFYLLFAWWLFMMSKKFWVKHAWMSFIPILQFYNLAAVADKSLLNYIVFPFIGYIVWIILWPITFWITTIAWVIYFLVMIIKLYHAISLRCWRWAWTTVWFLFISFIMFPVVWYTMEDKSNEIKKDDNDEETNIITEEKNENDDITKEL